MSPMFSGDSRKKVIVLLTMCFALFMAMLDNTVVNVALPTISRELGAGVSGLQWIVDGYVLAFATLLLTGGIAGDRYGRRRMFLSGLTVFTLASLACGLSQSTGQLIGFRAVQGIGASLLMPGTLSILSVTFPPTERAKAIGIWAGVSGLALALGPTAGGLLVEHVGWESIFFLNVPIGLIAFIVASRAVGESKAAEARELDLVGLGLGTAGLFSLTYALIEANQRGWGDGLIIGALAAGVVILTAFVLWERSTPRAMMPLSFFKIPAFSAGATVAFCISLGMFGTFFFFSLYMQFVRGYSALATGVRILPLTGMIFFVAPQAGRFAQRYGSRWPMTIGPLFAGTGLLLLSRVGLGTPYPVMIPVLSLMGTGMGMTMAPMTAAVMNAVGPERAGLGSATTNTAREVGGTFGIALLGTLLTTQLKSSLTTAIAGLGLPGARQAMIVATAGHGRLDPHLLQGLEPTQAQGVQSAFGASFLDGFHLALIVAAGFLVLAAIVANRFVPSGAPQHDPGEAPSVATKPKPARKAAAGPASRTNGRKPAKRKAAPRKPAGRKPPARKKTSARRTTKS
jgi:EmrB/QacA subfamily drug resistance transporter